MPDQKVKIELSTSSIFKIVAVILLLWFLYLIKGILIILFVALIFVSAIDPLVSWLRRHRIPAWVSVLTIYLTLIVLISLVIILFVPLVSNQIQKFSSNFPAYWQKIDTSLSNINTYSRQHGLGDSIQQSLKSLQLTLENSGQSVLSTVISIFGGVISFCVILVITFYIIVEENAVKRILRLVAPAKYQPYLTQLIYKVKDKIGLWLRGQVVLSLIVGCLVFIGMNGFGFIDPTMRQFALVLALIAFLGEFIPYLGPILSAIPAIFVAFTVSPSLALFVLIFYVVMQWLENNILVPQVMRRAVGLNPVVTIIALMIGAKIGGLIGILLAIPVATALMVITADFFERLEEN